MTPATIPDLAPETQFLPTDKEYRRTGILPEAEAEKTDEEIIAEQDSETPPEPSDLASETGKDAELPPARPQKKDKETTRREFEKLTSHNRELKAQVDALIAANKAPAQAQQTAPPPVTEAKEPQMTDFKTMGEYLTAVREFDRKQAVVAAKGEWEKSQKELRQQEQAKSQADRWQAKVDPAKKKYADFEEVALNPDLPVPVGSVAFAFLHDSDHGADVLYHLGSNPDKLAEINAMPPLKAARALYAIESEVSKPPSAPAVTKAPPPPHQVSGKGTTTGSAVEKAIEEGDFEAYRKAENAKALARLKRK